ncbi:merozoite surface protein 1-like [Chenopodium quinoa]|uniref:merozoite surface protein 1-like n=1 Tax=Chenopodium quinoa TaxID=63459 RepID=UPI000B77D816|nr:merozoite surface protein 1-like [Chenopodium quinoa]
MDSSVATDINNAKDYTDVHLERIMNSIEKESGANAGSSGAATVDAGSSGAPDEAGSPGVAAEAGSSGAGAEAGSPGVAAEAGSSGAVAEAGSSGALVAEEKISEKKKKKIKVVATKGKAKKVEKRVKEKHNVKFEDPDSEDAVDEVQKSKSVVYGTLRNRMSPSSVVNVFKEFSEDQLTAIRAIGFGSLEFLKVSQLPLQLGFWLVKHFDAHSCTLNIPDSDPFKITEQHVHDVLGLPAGGMEMDANLFSKDDKVINQWKKQFPKNSLSVNIGELSMYLKNHKSAGPMFKRNFVVLCVSTLMSGSFFIFIFLILISFCSF